MARIKAHTLKLLGESLQWLVDMEERKKRPGFSQAKHDELYPKAIQKARTALRAAQEDGWDFHYEPPKASSKPVMQVMGSAEGVVAGVLAMAGAALMDTTHRAQAIDLDRTPAVYKAMGLEADGKRQSKRRH